MAGQDWTPATQKRVTFLSVFDTLQGDYEASVEIVERLEADGFFDAPRSNPTSRQSGRSGGQGSSGRSSSRGRDQARGNGGGMRDPDGPPSEKQVAFLLRLTDDYTEDEVYDMTKKEVSELIEDLKG